jgi:hypothetical protein
MKDRLFIIGFVTIWAVVFVLPPVSAVLHVVFPSTWPFVLPAVLALLILVLVLLALAYTKAWYDGYASYGQPKDRALRYDLKAFPCAGGVLSLFFRFFIWVLCWPFTLISLFGYFRGKRAAQNSDEHEQKSSG